MGRQATDWQKNFQKTYLIKGCPKYTKNFQNSTIRKQTMKTLAEELDRHLTKKRYTDGKNHMKRFSISYTIRELQLDTTMYLLECPKSKILATPNPVEYVEQQELSFIAHGNGKWCSHFRREFGHFLTKLNMLIQYNNCTPWYLPKWVKNLCLHKNLYMTHARAPWPGTIAQPVLVGCRHWNGLHSGEKKLVHEWL